MNKIISFLRNWTLPVAMAAGVLIYLLFHLVDALRPFHSAVWSVERVVTPGFIFAQLLLAFCRVELREFRFRAWHFVILAFQVVVASVSYLALAPLSPVIAQGALVCLICPTATAAAVVTQKIGGNSETLITYTLLVNAVVSIYVPAVFPLVYEQEGLEFFEAFVTILNKVFPLLVLPLVVALLLKRLWPAAHDYLSRHSGFSFYIWAMALTVVMGKTAKSIVDDSDEMTVVLLLALVGLICCAVQFAFGKYVGSRCGERISAGQALGQKNTVLAIWMSLTYLHPLVSVAPGSYVLWQNIVNSYQIWKKRKGDMKGLKG